MSFDEEHLDDHYECQREVAARSGTLGRIMAKMKPPAPI
jgi:hypothetical protein